MSIAEKFEVITDEVYAKGRKDEWSDFWDMFQQHQSFDSKFAGSGWNDITFKPKYDIIIPSSTSANNLFSNTQIVDLEGILKRQGVSLDTSNAIRLDHLFFYSKKLLSVPEIEVGGKCTNIAYMFCDCESLHTIRKLTLPDITMTVTGMFARCTSLANIEIGGVIANDFAIDAAPLTVVSMRSIIDHLKNYSGTSNVNKFTVTFKTECWANLEETEKPEGFATWKAYVESLGWKVGTA